MLVPIFIAAKSMFSVTFVTLCQKHFYIGEGTLAPRPEPIVVPTYKRWTIFFRDLKC